ncbi:hypothetical protein MKS88_004192 [Plasmodium brasilianum]|uniref:Uncharacterized protein n=1 Tax=Plasmodium brasilianum TaxID=5824 RepID=A0ACB9Y4Y7_PLABR|nr:hypothetical protein MKS88_004192 [Plasmodium brasilianum]
MDTSGERDYVLERSNKIESIEINKKKKYSNLVSLLKKDKDHFSDNMLIEQKGQDIFKELPTIIGEESFCELRKRTNCSSNMKEIPDDMMRMTMMLHNMYNKTSSEATEDLTESSKYLKTYSSKKRVYTPSKFENHSIFNVENYQNDENDGSINKASMYSTPKKRYYSNKRKMNNKDDVDVDVDDDDDNTINTKELSDYEKIETADKWVMNKSHVNELPEHIKSEYVSYLCSPLKRSERLIKSKINKMLNANVESLKKETLGEMKEVRSNSGGNGNGSGNNNIVGNSNSGISESNNDRKNSGSSGTEGGGEGYQIMECDFKPEEEEKCWDDYYTQSNDKVRPFTGISTELAVNIISELLKSKVKKIKIENKELFSPITENDTIMEIGHGNHPLAVQMFEKWGTVGRYVGVEFSGLASKEALKCEKLKNLFLKRKVEFIKVLSMKYYKEDNTLDGIVTQSNISPPNTKTDFIKSYSFKYIFAKSTLDYITCRMDNIGNSCDWEEDLQISPSVVEMFNSLSDSLQSSGCKSSNSNGNNSNSSNGNNFNSCGNNSNSNSNSNSSNSNGKNNSCIIFVEPSNSSKFRDHVLTIFKVIYTATFKYNSSSKFLRLCKITNNIKACGYMIEKRNEVYQSFEQIRHEFLKLILKSSATKNLDEVDWYLPTTAPKKWLSNSPNDIEYLVKLDRSRL